MTNIYRVTTEIFDYDEYNAVVVLADSTGEAKALAFDVWLPSPHGHWRMTERHKHNTREPLVEVVLVGVADPSFKGGEFNPDGDSRAQQADPRLVLASFNAG